MRRLPPLSSLRMFEATARLGSVTKAADELGRTHGAVSRQIRALQDRAGFALFDKAGTGLRLNAQGGALLRAVQEGFDTIEREWERLRSDARGAALHVACSATFAMRWLVPRLPEFYRDNPQTRLRLSMTTAQALRHEGADLVIAWDRSSYPTGDRARAIRVGDVAFRPVCAPGYPVSQAQGRLTFGTRIAHEFTSKAWENWSSRSGLGLAFDSELSFPHTHLCIEAALRGLGVALAEQRLVEEDIVAGRLLPIADCVSFEDGLAVIPTSDRAGSDTARVFIDWLRAGLV